MQWVYCTSVVFWHRISGDPGSPYTHYVAPLALNSCPAVTSLLLGVQACATTPAFNKILPGPLFSCLYLLHGSWLPLQSATSSWNLCQSSLRILGGYLPMSGSSLFLSFQILFYFSFPPASFSTSVLFLKCVNKLGTRNRKKANP